LWEIVFKLINLWEVIEEESIKNEIWKKLKSIKENLFENFYLDKKSFITLYKKKDKKEKQKEFDNIFLWKNEETVVNLVNKYYEKEKEAIKLNLIDFILIQLKKYQNSLKIWELTEEYATIQEKELKIKNEIDELKKDYWELEIEKASKNKKLEQDLITLVNDLNNFYSDWYKLSKFEQIKEINKLFIKFNKLKNYIWNLEFYEIHKNNLKGIKREIQQNLLYEILNKKENSLKILKYLEKIDDKDLKTEFEKYLKKEVKILFFSKIYNRDFSDLEKFSSIINDVNNVKNFIEDLDEKIQNINLNTNLWDIKNIINTNFEIFWEFWEEVKEVFEYDFNKKLSEKLKIILENILEEYQKSENNNYEITKEITEILNLKNKDEIFSKITEIYKKYYNTEKIDNLNLDYLRIETLNNFKNFNIKIFENFINKENYNNIFKTEIERLKLKLSNLGIWKIIVSNHYFINENELTINWNDNNYTKLNEIIELLEKIKEINFEISIINEIDSIIIDEIKDFLENLNIDEYKEKWYKK
jgi:hypothetical protein